MKYQPSISLRTKVLVATFVVVALSALVSIASDASTEATIAKAQQFEASTAIQTAARERKGSKLANAK